MAWFAAKREDDSARAVAAVALVAVNVLALIALTREVADYYARQMTVYRPTLNQWTNRDEFRRVYSVYSVPSRGGEKPVIVVRPLRLNEYSSRF